MAVSTGTPPTPEELFVRWRDRGDAEALGAVFDAEAPVLFKTAVVICSDPCTAEEAVQETFLAAMESADRWDDGRRVGPWLTGILRMKLLEIRRRDGRRPDPHRVPPPLPLEDPAEKSAVTEEVERVRTAIRALPEPYRHAALLRWCYGLEPAEIADLRGEPPGTTWSILSRAMAKLRKELGGLAALAPMLPLPKGLPAVRRVVMERARATGSGDSAGRAAPQGPGALRIPPAAAAAGLLLAGGIAFLLLRPSAMPPAREFARAPEAAAPSRSASARPTAGPETAAAALPPPVDPAVCDPDRDLHGVVVDAAGLPAAGARITTYYRPFGDVFFLGPGPSRERTPGPAVLAASDGTFRLALERGRYCDVKAEGPGGSSCVLGWRLAGERVRLALRVPPTVVLRTVDPDGNPIAGVLLHPGAMDESGRKEQFATVTTGPDGVATLPPMPPGSAWLVVEHPTFRGHLPAWVGVPAEGTRRLDLRLEPGRAVRGVVRDGRTGRPVVGAVVGEGAYLLNPVRTDAEGRFEALVEPGLPRTSVAAAAPGYSRAEAYVPEEGPLEISLRAGDSLVGRFVDPSGAPVADVLVACLGRATAAQPDLRIDFASARSGADGRFRLADLRHGLAYTLVAESGSCGRLMRDFAADPAEEGGTADLGDVVLPPARAVEGVLLDSDGVPFPDGVVVLAAVRDPWAGGRTVESFARRTDARGRFRFQGCAPGEYVLSVGASPRFPAASVALSVGEREDARDVALRLPRSVATELAAVDPAGRPVGGVVLQVATGGRTVEAFTDERGRVRFAVEAGATFRAKAYDPAAPRRWLQEAADGVETVADGSEVRLAMRRVATIRGRVVGEDGAPVPGAGVACRDAGTGASWNTNAGRDGAFSMEVSRGRIEAWARAKGGPSSAAVEARAGEYLELRLFPAGKGTLTVRVVDPAGNPVPGVALTAPAVPKSGPPVTGPGGEVVLKNLGGGEFPLALLPALPSSAGRSALPEGTAPPEPLRVVPDGRTVVLRLRPGVERSGIALGADGLPSPGAAVRVLLEDGSVAAAVADADGRWRAWVPAGVAVTRTVVGE